MLYHVIAERHGCRSTIATTNLPFKAWGSVLGDAGSIVPLVDRFSENLHVMDIEGTPRAAVAPQARPGHSALEPRRSRRS